MHHRTPWTPGHGKDAYMHTRRMDVVQTALGNYLPVLILLHITRVRCLREGNRLRVLHVHW